MSLKENYKKSWKYIKEIKNYIIFAILIFIASAVFGFFKPVYFTNIIENLIKSLLERTTSMSIYELIIFIFENNLKTSFFSLIFGIILGIFPVLNIILNGYVIGFVASKSVSSLGFVSLWRLLPHGIFEIPAVLISIGLGIRLGSFLFVRNKKKRFLYDFENCLRVFAYVVLPLLIIAAIIEGILIAM